MEKQTREQLVQHLIELLEKENAHASFEKACANVPAELLNQAVPNVPYTLWQLVEHVRIAQWDIVEFCINPDHKSPKWPDEYWPQPEDKADVQRWQEVLNQIKQDRARFIALLHDPKQDLFTPLAHGDGQTLFREALLIADHTAYHTGEIILVRRLLQNWA